MRWWRRLSTCSTWAFCVRAFSLTATLTQNQAWTSERKIQARETTRDLWYHGFDNYMNYAFPMDELQPISCQGRGPDWDNPANVGLNDVNGNYSVTLIDVLDTFVVLNDTRGFAKAVKDVIENVSFNVNTKPQIFETTIRAMGGLLSAHIFATTDRFGFELPWYRGELLDLAKDLGDRMLPAFNTPTGLPYARVKLYSLINLRHGLPRGETTQTCTAAAGSLLLEFATLSRLTGNDIYEKVAEKAFKALWDRRSDLGLVGNTIDVVSGQWVSPVIGGIGAGIDSFYEYALKMYVYTGEDQYWDIYEAAYSNIMKHSLGNDLFFYRAISPYTGEIQYNHIDSLGAFWPGLQVLGGDLDNAIKSHMIYWNLWRRFSGIPESFNILTKEPITTGYPLRPEFIESTYFLYRATKDPFYLDVGERVLRDLTARAKVPCGLASVSNLLKHESEDRMESFVLSETLKYLYLLFDEDNTFNTMDDNFVFTTEGHILMLPKQHLKPTQTPRQNPISHQCSVYRSPFTGSQESLVTTKHGLVGSIYTRSDMDLARYLSGATMVGPEAKADSRWWTPDGICFTPKPDIQTSEFIMSAPGTQADEDVNPDHTKLALVSDGFVVHDITGIRLTARTTVDGKGYVITAVGPHNVSREQKVYFTDRKLLTDDPAQKASNDIVLQFYLSPANSSHVGSPQENAAKYPVVTSDITIDGTIASFGHDPRKEAAPIYASPQFNRGSPAALGRVYTNLYGCDTYKAGTVPDATMLWVLRGECTFLEKLTRAKEAGALGVIVGSEDDRIVPSIDDSEVAWAKKELNSVSLMLVTSGTQSIETMLDLGERDSQVVVMVVVKPSRDEIAADGSETAGERRKRIEDTRASLPARPLFINGKRLENGILAF